MDNLFNESKINQQKTKDKFENFGDFIGPIFNFFKNRLNYKSNRVITDFLDTPRIKRSDSKKSTSHFKRNSIINWGHSEK